jgi:peptidoglycan/xylan/chitin deacetylase (PgdA/CDA1 family)
MNLVSFSIRTKGARNFTRRLGTVFTRFGVSETPTRNALHSIIDSLRQYGGAPTFFIPAVVLDRYPALISGIAHDVAEIGIHGYVHNDYRTLSKGEQYKQTKRAISVFQKNGIPYQGFRNPYLGWTEESLDVCASLGFNYDSNVAVLHDIVGLNTFSPFQRSSYAKSLKLCQAVPCTVYALRPQFEAKLLRIPISIPDDEMLFDRLRIADPQEIGGIWSKVMQRVYECGGLYTLNLHPERGVLCKQALDRLLSYARSRPLPVWLARVGDIAKWWKERSAFRLNITSLGSDHWQIEAVRTPRATLLARYLTVEDQPVTPWYGNDVYVQSHCFTVKATCCPCIGVSPQTPQQVLDFLYEQGYPVVCCSQEEAHSYAMYLDEPEGLGTTREKQAQRRSALVQQIEALDRPFLYFGCWPTGSRAALAISGDIDAVTVQDFFLRIVEVLQH